MRTVAKKVSWGAPLREHSEHSDSSGGVHVYGRGADKPVDKEKKQKRSENKKHSKASSERTSNDILDSVEIVQRKDKGKAMPGGRGGKGISSSRGRGGLHFYQTKQAKRFLIVVSLIVLFCCDFMINVNVAEILLCPLNH